MTDIKPQADTLLKPGKYKTGVGCLYINKMEGIDIAVLKGLIDTSLELRKNKLILIKIATFIVFIKNKCSMKNIVCFITCLMLSCVLTLSAQTTSVTLSGTSYTETFDNLGDGLPQGWALKTATTQTNSGSNALLTTAPTLWNITSGRFNNYASGDIGETGDQSTATDRALGIRQTGSFGDPGGAFVIRVSNTSNLSNFNLSLKLQSLDKTSTRTSSWGIDYAIGDSTSFISAATIPTQLTTGNLTFSNQMVTVNFGSALDNKSNNVWIRIRSISASTGSGNRPSTAIDDFTLTYQGGVGSNEPTMSVIPASLSFSNTEGVTSDIKEYSVQGSNLTGPLEIIAPTHFEISTSNTSGFTNMITLSPSAGSIASKIIYVRMQNVIKGNFNGLITHTSNGAESKNVTVSGTVTAPITIISIAEAKAKADSTLVSITGRLTVTGQFGGRLIYVQDQTAGMAVFGESVNLFPAGWQIGDSVTIAGMLTTFNGLKEIVNISRASVVTGQINNPIIPKIITADQQLANEGRLVKIKDFNFIQSGTFKNSTNYDVADCNNTYITVRINVDVVNTLINASIPTNTRDIVGIAGIFNTTPQLLPRSITDISGVASNQCIVRGVCPPSSTLVPVNSIERSKTFDVAAWNVAWLGHPEFGPSNEQLQQDNVKCILDKLQSDVIVISELCDTSKLSFMVPAGYGYKCSTQFYSHFYDTPETASDPAQKICMVYNKATVVPIDSECKAILTNLATYTVDSPNNSFWASGRLPYMFTANVNINGSTKKIRVVGLHAKAGSAITDYQRRLADVQALKKELDDNYANDNLIIAGDFNDDLDTSITLGQASSYANFVLDAGNYRGVTKELSDSKRRSTVSQTEMIDHMIISNELYAAYEDNTVGVATSTNINFIKAYGTSTSDHYPVWARFDLSRPTVSATETNASINKLDVKFNPNPTNGFAYITVTSDSGKEVEISAYNVLSQQVYFSKNKVDIGLQNINIDIPNLESGLYYFVIKQGNLAKNIKVVKI